MDIILIIVAVVLLTLAIIFILTANKTTHYFVGLMFLLGGIAAGGKSYDIMKGSPTYYYKEYIQQLPNNCYYSLRKHKGWSISRQDITIINIDKPCSTIQSTIDENRKKYKILNSTIRTEGDN
jgi:hypothetical protein